MHPGRTEAPLRPGPDAVPVQLDGAEAEPISAGWKNKPEASPSDDLDAQVSRTVARGTRELPCA